MFLGRNLEFFQFRDESFPCLPRLHGLVNGKDLPVRTNIESPSVREFARRASVSEYSVRCSCFLSGIGENRKIRVFLFGERCIVFELIRTDHEIVDVVFLDHFPALTERATFGRSTTGKGFREPSQYDGFPLQFRERIGLAIASLEREIRRGISDFQLLSHRCSGEESSQRDGDHLDFSFHMPSWALYLFPERLSEPPEIGRTSFRRAAAWRFQAHTLSRMSTEQVLPRTTLFPSAMDFQGR